jgi:hypothetical protein
MDVFTIDLCKDTKLQNITIDLEENSKILSIYIYFDVRQYSCEEIEHTLCI